MPKHYELKRGLQSKWLSLENVQSVEFKPKIRRDEKGHYHIDDVISINYSNGETVQYRGEDQVGTMKLYTEFVEALNQSRQGD